MNVCTDQKDENNALQKIIFLIKIKILIFKFFILFINEK